MLYPGFLLTPGTTTIDSIGRRDEALVAATKAGSDAAFAELQRCYSKRLLGRIRSITKSREDAEDALQNTFFRAFLAIDSFEGKSQFSTWLSRIAINSALSILRKRRNRIEVSLQHPSDSEEDTHFYDVCDTTPNPEEICDQEQRRNQMFRAIERLSPKLRTAIWIWLSQDCSTNDLARALDATPATVKSRLHRARQRLLHVYFDNAGSRSRSRTAE